MHAARRLMPLRTTLQSIDMSIAVRNASEVAYAWAIRKPDKRDGMVIDMGTFSHSGSLRCCATRNQSQRSAPCAVERSRRGNPPREDRRNHFTYGP